MMTRCRRLLLIAPILFSCVGCDQASKSAARKYLAHSAPISYFCDILRLQYAENKGAFLSFGSGLPEDLRFWALVVFTGIAAAGFLFFVLGKRALNPYFAASAALIAAGGAGNLIDRVANHGAGIDFLNLGIGPLRTGVFNFADVAILAGAGILIFAGRGIKSQLRGNPRIKAGAR